MAETYKKGAQGELVIERAQERRVHMSHLKAQITCHEEKLVELKKLLEEAKKLGIKGAKEEEVEEGP